MAYNSHMALDSNEDRVVVGRKEQKLLEAISSRCYGLNDRRNFQSRHEQAITYSHCCGVVIFFQDNLLIHLIFLAKHS